MRRKFKFQANVVHEGTQRRDGDELWEDEFPDGSLGPCLRMRFCREMTADEVEASEAAAKKAAKGPGSRVESPEPEPAESDVGDDEPAGDDADDSQEKPATSTRKRKSRAKKK